VSCRRTRYPLVLSGMTHTGSVRGGRQVVTDGMRSSEPARADASVVTAAFATRGPARDSGAPLSPCAEPPPSHSLPNDGLSHAERSLGLLPS
jgi:hypothetical protein